MKIGPFDIARGSLLPFKIKGKRSQRKNEAGDGTVIVSDSGWSAKYLSVRVVLAYDDALLLQGYLENGIRGAATVISLVDDYGVLRSVRYWGDGPEMKAIASNLYEMNLLFRQEVA